MTNAYAADEMEAFIEKNIAPGRPFLSSDAEGRRARAGADRNDAELARRELSAGGLDLERLDTLARERADARRSRAHEQRRRAVEESTAVDRWLTGLTPVLPIDPASMNIIIDRVTFIRTFADAGVVTDSHIGSLDSWARYRFCCWQADRAKPGLKAADPMRVKSVENVGVGFRGPSGPAAAGPGPAQERTPRETR